ncbi:hypothetical protein BRADI_4g02676v3 [Brachypodium distachyon]|uniref:Uncharacterized protein n=1 Tax=Brachypodium distachyon TaxID=15368 RepID=A0A0Q3L0Z3_BRADI|nr:hypothetical protein BRADI_4g02676v3 [Brachypodium distachyon]
MFHAINLTSASLFLTTNEPSKENQHRAEDLYYLIFHDLNKIRPLPNSLEKFRPMITHMWQTCFEALVVHPLTRN